jgi:hypothetical protein
LGEKVRMRGKEEAIRTNAPHLSPLPGGERRKKRASPSER